MRILSLLKSNINHFPKSIDPSANGKQLLKGVVGLNNGLMDYFVQVQSQIKLSFTSMETHNTTFMNNLRPAKLIAVKISNFAPELQERQLQLGRYSEEQRLSQRRNMVQSSLSNKRRPFESEFLEIRNAKTSQHSRFSQYVEREVTKIHDNLSHLEDFSPMVRDKIKELKGLIEQKARAIKTSTLKPPEKYFFSEYKMKSIESSRKFSLALHSRNKMDSPFMKIFKSKKVMSSRNGENQNSAQEEGNSSDKKMVLVGGSLSGRRTSPQSIQQNTPTSPKKVREERGKIHHRYYLRRVWQPQPHETAEQILENDCKPWQIHKQQHLQQYGHVNYI